MNYQEIINLFKDTAVSPGGEAVKWKKEQQGKVIGFLLTDVPEELIHAAGYLPFAVNAEEGQFDYADTHLQTWACSFTRNSLAAAVQGKLSYLDGLIIPQTCDTTRMLMGIWKHAVPLPYMENFRLPRQVERSSAGNYLRGELARIKKSLENFCGHLITNEKLEESISLYNKNRTYLRKLYQIHEQNPKLLSGKDLFMIIKSSMVMSREKVNKLLVQLVAQLEKEVTRGGPKSAHDRYIRLLLSGSLLAPLEILDLINEAGGVVVADDFKNGSRYLEGDVPENMDPLEALAERQLQKIPSALYDPQKHSRTGYLIDLARKKDVKGVIFLHLKFCEPENYDFYDNMQAMEKNGIPAIRLETAYGGISPGQLQTRVHAFMEMLGGGNIE